MCVENLYSGEDRIFISRKSLEKDTDSFILNIWIIGLYCLKAVCDCVSESVCVCVGGREREREREAERTVQRKTLLEKHSKEPEGSQQLISIMLSRPHPPSFSS